MDRADWTGSIDGHQDLRSLKAPTESADPVILGRMGWFLAVLVALILATLLLAHASVGAALRHNAQQLRLLTGSLQWQLEQERQAREQLQSLIGG